MPSINDSLKEVSRRERLFVDPLGFAELSSLYSSIPVPAPYNTGNCLPCVICGFRSAQWLEVLRQIKDQGPSPVGGSSASDTIVDPPPNPPVDPPPPDPNCPDPLDVAVLGSWTTCDPSACTGDSECEDGTIPTVDLTPYQTANLLGNGISRIWRVWETGGNCCSSYPSGVVSPSGTLLNLPNSFSSTYCYEGFVELQQGVITCEGVEVWPS